MSNPSEKVINNPGEQVEFSYSYHELFIDNIEHRLNRAPSNKKDKVIEAYSDMQLNSPPMANY